MSIIQEMVDVRMKALSNEIDDVARKALGISDELYNNKFLFRIWMWFFTMIHQFEIKEYQGTHDIEIVVDGKVKGVIHAAKYYGA